MNIIKINHQNTNLEVVSKIMDSACAKYDCKVKYNKEQGTVDFSGDEAYKTFIAKETLNFFNKQ